MQQYEKQCENSIRNDENGFSVVEVLVAVFVLAIIFTPILRSFLMAAQTNSRAQEIQNATAIAESLMEEAKGKTINALRTNSECTVTGYDSTGAPTTDDQKAVKYIVDYKGISRTQGKTYDARVTLSTRTTDVASFNDIDFPQLMDIDSSKNIVISHEINRYDGSALETILDRTVKYDPDTPWNASAQSQWERYTFGGKSIVDKFQKRVEINILESTDIYADCDVYFEVRQGTDADFAPLNYSVYSYSVRKDADADSNDNNIYIFYSLMYDSSEIQKRRAIPGSESYRFNAGREELNIHIEPDVLPGRDIYLIIQKDKNAKNSYSLDTSNPDVLKVAYSCSYPETLEINNVTQGADGLSINGHRMFINMTGSYSSGSDTTELKGNLYTTEKIDTVFDMTVDVYEEGEIPAVGETNEDGKLATINSTVKKKQ